MKKYLFLLCLAGGLCPLSAQKTSNSVAIDNGKVRVLHSAPSDLKKMTGKSSQKKYAPFIAESYRMKSENGETTHTGEAYYRIPEGSLYSAMDLDWGYYSNTFIYTPAMVDVKWANYCTLDSAYAERENVSWTVGYAYGEDDIVEENVDSLMNEYGSLVMSQFGFSTAPEVHLFSPEDKEHTDAIDSYRFYFNTVEPEESFWMAGTSTLEYIGNACLGDDLFYKYNDSVAFTINKNFIDNGLNEDGDVVWNNTGMKCVGLAELYDAPSEMLYVTSVNLHLWAEEIPLEGPILEGKTLTAEILKFTGSGFETFATATAGEENLIYDSEYECGVLNFRFVEDDPVFGLMDAPVVLDSTSAYMVQITGFEQLQSVWTCPFTSADGFYGHGYAILEDGSYATLGYFDDLYNPMVDLCISFEAALPVAEVPEMYEDVTIRIPAEGGRGVSLYDEERQIWYEDFSIYTLSTIDCWERIDDLDWVEIDYDDEDIAYGIISFYLSAEALPKDVEGRYGEVIMSLFGKEIAIPVSQGELPSGIRHRAVDSNSIMYNILGHQIQHPTKGKVYILNGQKVLAE